MRNNFLGWPTRSQNRKVPNAIWTGSLSLGLVVVPVRLYPAVKKKNVRFLELDGGGHRVRHVRVSEPDLEFVPPAGHVADLRQPERAELPEIPELAFEAIRKGYEVAPGQYVTMTREEVAELAPERSRVIDVEQFVDVAALDPIYFESRNSVVPDRRRSSPFRGLRQSLAPADLTPPPRFTT